MSRLSHRLTIDCEFIDVAEIITHQPSDWLLPFFRIAAQEGHQVGAGLRAALRVAVLPQPAHRHIEVEYGVPENILGGAIELPFRWRALGFPALFALFTGRFMIWPASAGGTVLAVEGECEFAPQVSDDVIGATAATRAAEAALRGLTGKLKAAIEEQVRPRSRRS